MHQKRLLKILAIFLALVAGLSGFYIYMTYDRSYMWVKEYKEELEIAAEKSGFQMGKTDEIDVAKIQRSKEKTIKIKIQRVLGMFNLMNYGHEFGEITTLTTKNNEGLIHCKGWCLDDYLIGLEIEYSNIDETKLTSFKDNLEQQFDNYRIKWTEFTK